MARLPQPGGDTGTWGDILNEYLLTAHKADGTLKDDVVSSASMGNGSITPTKLNADTPANGDVLSYNGSGFEWITVGAATGSGEVNTASNVGTGGVGIYRQKVGADLEFKNIRGASNRVAVTNNTTTNTVDIDINTANLALTKADVGLANVDNTSDANKPVSSATLTALNTKANTTTTVTGSGSIAGGGSLAADRTLSLSGDSATPGNSKYYGTNASGTKGFYDLPAGVTDPSLGGDLTGTASNAQIAAGAVGAAEIADGSITNAEVSATAAIAQSKIAGLTGDLAGKANATHTHAAGDITSGTIAAARLGTGTADGTTYLRGDGTWATPAGGGGGGADITATHVITTETSYTASVGQFVVVNRTGTQDGVTILLPSPQVGAQVCVVHADSSSNFVLIDLPGSLLINGSPTFAMNTQYQSATFVSDGTTWYVF